MELERRMDVLTANAINRAIEIDRAEGAIRAWIYLTQLGVSTETIQRILNTNGTLGANRPTQGQPPGRSVDRRRS